MASSNIIEQSMSSSSFKPDVSEALRNRQGCEVAHALKGMSAGEQLDAIRSYQRDSKQDPQNFPKIDVNFDKNGYEIKAKPNPETNQSAKPNKSESILNHKMDQNDETTSLACKNETMKPAESMQGVGGHASGGHSSDLSHTGSAQPSSADFMGATKFDSGKGQSGDGLQGSVGSDSKNSKSNNDGLPPAGSDSSSSSPPPLGSSGAAAPK